MKKLILTILILFSFTHSVFADVDLKMSIPENEIEVNSTFQVEIEILNDSDNELLLKSFDWTDYYQHLWTSHSQQVSINNDIVNKKELMVFSFVPEKTWEFILWPVVFTDWENDFQSNTGSIVIKNTEENLINIENSETLEDNMYFDFKIFITILYIIFWILFIWLFYFILMKYFNNKVNQEIKINKNLEKEEKNNFWIEKKIINTLNNFNKEEEIEDFYKKIQLLSRSYFEAKWLDFAFQKTFEEIEKSIENNELKNIFKEVYYGEFKNKVPSLKEQNDIIERFLKFLQK